MYLLTLNWGFRHVYVEDLFHEIFLVLRYIFQTRLLFYQNFSITVGIKIYTLMWNNIYVK